MSFCFCFLCCCCSGGDDAGSSLLLIFDYVDGPLHNFGTAIKARGEEGGDGWEVEGGVSFNGRGDDRFLHM